MKKTIITMMLIGLCTNFAHAEGKFCKWEDEQGNLHFSNVSQNKNCKEIKVTGASLEFQRPVSVHKKESQEALTDVTDMSTVDILKNAIVKPSKKTAECKASIDRILEINNLMKTIGDASRKNRLDHERAALQSTNLIRNC